MDYYPTDTVDRPIADTLPLQSNTPAPMVAVHQDRFAIPDGGMQWHQWVTPRNLFGVSAGLALLIIGMIALRSSAVPQNSIAIEPLKEPKVSMDKVNDFIVNEASDDLEKLIFATDERIRVDQLVLEHKRAKDITDWANKLLTDKNSNCFKSEHQKKCGLSVYLREQGERYRDAYRSQKWVDANKALFEARSARIAWNGFTDSPLNGDLTATAIHNEAGVRIEKERLSPNAIAAKDAEKGGKNK